MYQKTLREDIQIAISIDADAMRIDLNRLLRSTVEHTRKNFLTRYKSTLRSDAIRMFGESSVEEAFATSDVAYVTVRRLEESEKAM